MAILAFKDDKDGYYQTEVKDGDPLPEWAEKLTPCPVDPAANPPEVALT